MNSRKWVKLFLTTLLIGGLAGLFTSFFVKYEEYLNVLSPFDLMEVFGLVVFFVGLGLVFSVISQTGFFAYLFINQFGLSLFRGFWPTVQGLLVLFVLFDLVYFPYKETNDSLLLYIGMALGLFVVAWIVARIKVHKTNIRAFMPTLFLMVVMTAIEWVPGLRTSGTDYAWLMIVPLVACNAYQVLILHTLTNDGSDKKAPVKGGKPNKQNSKKRKK